MKSLKWAMSCLVVAAFVSFASLSCAFSQTLSAEDSLLVEQAKDDTVQLRQIATKRKGERVAARAMDRIGYVALKGNDLIKASAEYTSVRDSYLGVPEGTEALFFLGRVAWQKKDFATAREKFSLSLKEIPQGQWAEASHYYLIKTLLEEKDPSAITEMRSFLQARPGASYSPHVQFLLVRYFRNAGDYASALTEARKLTEGYSGNPYREDLQYQIGDYLLRLGRKDEALTHYGTLLKEAAPGSEAAAIAEYLTADAYARTGDHAKAREMYGRVRAIYPQYTNWSTVSEFAEAQLIYQRAVVEKDTLLTIEARKLLAGFTLRHPTDKRTPGALMTLASLFRVEGKTDEALARYNNVIAFDGNSMTNVASGYEMVERSSLLALKKQAHLEKALLYRTELQRADLALREYDAILSEFSEEKEARLGKAMSLIMLGEKELARPILESLAKEESPEGELALRMLGELSTTAKEEVQQ